MWFRSISTKEVVGVLLSTLHVYGYQWRIQDFLFGENVSKNERIGSHREVCTR